MVQESVHEFSCHELFCKVQYNQAFDASKTALITFGQRGPSLIMFGTEVRPKSYVKYLGITFDSKLSWTRHAKLSQAKVSKVNQIIRQMSASRRLTSIHCLIRLIQSVVYPITMYEYVCWGSSKDASDIIQIFINGSIRSILKMITAFYIWQYLPSVHNLTQVLDSQQLDSSLRLQPVYEYSKFVDAEWLSKKRHNDGIVRASRRLKQCIMRKLEQQRVLKQQQ
ncbi:hypothetical protein MIR68_012072 [Amoeboaphelidium protococcarum]|nr:hypothetical protein MIR68_012072 [Amoeboaphelidium protococcarum]